MSEEKLYSIREVALKQGISQQAVYKKLNSTLKEFVIEKDGQKYIKSAYLDTIEPKTEVDNPLSTVEQPSIKPVEQPFNNSCQPSLNEVLSILQQQLIEKDKQIALLQDELSDMRSENAKKDTFIQQQAERLTTLLENSQMLEAASKVMLSNAQKDEPELPINADPVQENPEPHKKPGLLQQLSARLFSRNK